MTQSRIFEGKFKARRERGIKESSELQEKKRKSPEESRESHVRLYSSVGEKGKDQEVETEEQLESEKRGSLECYRCGGPHKWRYCGLPPFQLPPRSAVCSHCGKRNHMAKNCWSAPKTVESSNKLSKANRRAETKAREVTRASSVGEKGVTSFRKGV